MKPLSRRVARERILKLLFQRDFRSVIPEELCPAEHDHYVRELIAGITAQQAEIDRLIASKAEGWRLERLYSVDRNILRLAIYELLYRKDVPPEAVINEAIELAKKYSGEHSPIFINGILDRILKELPQGPHPF